MERYYNIHGLVTVKTNVKGFFPEYFKTGKTKDVDMEIIESDFSFDKKRSEKIGSFYGDDNSVYFESSVFGIPVYKILIEDLEGRTKFHFTKTTNRIFNVHKLAFSLFQIKLLQNGASLVHAGCVSKNRKAKIVFGWSGVGKSSTLFGLIENDSFGFLGDDTVILSSNGKVYSYPQRVGVFYKSENFESLQLSKTKSFELWVRYLISKIPPFNRYIGAKMLIDISNVVKFDESSDIGRFYFLENGNGEERIEKNKAINRIIASTVQSFFDHYLSNKMFYAYCYTTGFDPGYIEKCMRSILNKTVKNPVIIRSVKKDFHNKLIG